MNKVYFSRVFCGVEMNTNCVPSALDGDCFSEEQFINLCIHKVNVLSTSTASGMMPGTGGRERGFYSLPLRSL